MEKKEKVIYTYFRISCDSTHVGENVYVTGNVNCLGNWNPDQSVKLYTSSSTFPMWESKVHELIYEHDEIEYKYIIKDNHSKNITWENFKGNRTAKISDILNLAKSHIAFSVEIQDEKFGVHKKPGYFIIPLKLELKEIENGEGMKENSFINTEIKLEEAEKKKKHEYMEFVGSQYLADLVNTFVKGNQEKTTWKEKLSFIWDLLKDKQIVDKELLALVSVYLFYINTGQIKCREDGQHFRPNHHSSLAYNIFTFLLKIPGEDYSLIIRSILKNLPSFADQYMVSVPLTRIRDIAHRNDIPRDLKQEIKTTLQNKLHRSASPDDLKTCENILSRITAHGANYSHDFVNEFKIFYEELKEFFNALGLEKALSKLNELIPENLSNVKHELNKMLHLKHESIDKSLEKFEQINKLRELLVQIISEQMKDESKCSKTLMQISSTCDIELENLSYSILSEYIEKYYYHSKVNEDGYQNLIKICFLCLDSMIISNNKTQECIIIKEDLIYFSSKFTFDFTSNKSQNIEKHRLAALKLKSVLERCLNLFYEITEDVNKYFNIPVFALGKALNINPHSVTVYCESFVRAHTIFQFSKVITLLLHRIREILKLPPFITISTGTMSGYFLHINKLSDFNPDKHKLKEYVIFLNESDGTEEIPNEIKAVILSHDLPQLSHLAIRARQNRAAFICCLDNSIYKYEYVKKFHAGDYLRVIVKGDDNIKIEKIEKKENKNGKKLDENEEKMKKDECDDKDATTEFNILNSKIDEILEPIIDISKAEHDISGSKCTNMKELKNIENDLYVTPKSLCIPYEVYVKYASSILTEDDLNEIDNCPFEEIEKKSEHLREKFISKAMHLNKELEEIVNTINEKLSEDVPLAIRSSSNLEDLKKSAGAGLFDSYLGIKNNQKYKEEIKYSICRVWASLFTIRGLIARRNNKIPSHKAKMGILVQEMININCAFVIHTVNPINLDQNEVYMEMCIGMGETLASARQRGSPYRLIYKKKEDQIIIYNFASFSNKIKDGIEEGMISYRNEILSTNDEYLTEIGRRLGKISILAENYFGGVPQDLEGGVLDDKIYLMQTRPQII